MAVIVKYKDKPRKQCNLRYVWRFSFKMNEGVTSEQIIEQIKRRIKINQAENGREWAWQIMGGYKRLSKYNRLGMIETWL